MRWPCSIMNKLEEGFGWYGFLAIVGAYAGVAIYPWLASSIVYKLLNLTGAIGLAIISGRKKAWQPAALNTTWTFLALISLFR